MPLPRSIRSFQLRPGSPVEARLHHWLGQLAAYCASLDPVRHPVEGIHQLRLVSKALRAAIRLADGGQPGADLLRHDRAIRKLAGLVSGARDAQVQSELLLKLARKQPDAFRAAVEILIRRRTPRKTSSDISLRVVRGVATEASALQALLPGRIDPISISKAIRRVYRKTLGWRERAVEAEVPTDFHAWRRWQKRLEAQLRLAGTEKTDAADRLLRDLHEMQEDLGALHDADELEERLAGEAQWRGIAPGIRRRLLKLLEQRQRELRRHLVKRSRKVLGRRLRQCCRSTAKVWEKVAQTA